MPFATKPHELEKEIGLASDGEPAAAAHLVDLELMQSVCAANKTHVAVVIDAESEIVCLAPLYIARLIAKLLTESDEVDPRVYPVES